MGAESLVGAAAAGAFAVPRQRRYARIRTENRRRKADRVETLMRVSAARRLAYRAGL